ncbi:MULTISPECIES: amidohydrolase [Haloferax]|uniref:N-substituted formamide deformylase n=1 Tax=Haloferax massiliensis TaxID=1476858 RepID=A0A0D6JPA2_9EURY|nr:MULTISPECIES: amidohydrolase [Haloferax]MDS0240996.1 amidohydrolase [Haloferax sp. S2CR25]MDS0444117.1 amidohydrolase [Haloferax sp. S2CR25-2]CQR49380.1 N-substituted formamide deformylase precursor [Haloferax massiliensis]
MTASADLVLTNAEVHTLGSPDETHEAVAVRDGEVVRVGRAFDVELLAGVETRVVDCEGRVVLPGFIDAHTHLPMVGRSLVHADLSAADSPAEAVELLRERAAEVERENGADGDGADDNETGGDGGTDWVFGYGYDESTWDDSRYLTRDDLDAVSESLPVVAFREDLHTAGVNSVVLDRYADEMPDEGVQTAGDDGPSEGDGDGDVAVEPTGVVVEGAVDVLREATEPGREEMTELVRAAQSYATARGVTGVHDMVRGSRAPEVYRDLAEAGELALRVRINYWSDHLDALREVGLRTNHGGGSRGGLVTVGAIKTFTDGSFGGRTAKLTEPYADAAADPDAADDETGQWVVDPEELRGLVADADESGYQFTAHAIGDAAVDAVLDAYEETDDPGAARHRVEHVELASDEAIERFAESGVVASVQPNFLKWADEGGLYDARLGERRLRTNRYRDLLDAGVDLAFGSDCMPLGPLLGVDLATDHPNPDQSLTVTEALRAYTSGAAHAGFDEDRLGTVAVGTAADLVVLDESPWEADSIRDIAVSMTVVDGRVVFERD